MKSSKTRKRSYIWFPFIYSLSPALLPSPFPRQNLKELLQPTYSKIKPLPPLTLQLLPLCPALSPSGPGSASASFQTCSSCHWAPADSQSWRREGMAYEQLLAMDSAPSLSPLKTYSCHMLIRTQEKPC